MPFFHNRHTGTNWYLGRDLLLSALEGYRLEVLPIQGTGAVEKGRDIKIDDQTTLDDLTFTINGPPRNFATRFCLYNPQGDVVGGNDNCTDSYYRHNYNPYTSVPAGYSYGKAMAIKTISPKQDFIDDYKSYSDIISNSAEVTFALRFFHNDNVPLRLNVSDVYQIDLGRYKATITEKETGKPKFSS